MKKDVGMTTAQKSKETRRMESLFCISSQQSLHIRTLLHYNLKLPDVYVGIVGWIYRTKIPSFLFPYFFEQWSSLHLFSFHEMLFPLYEYWFSCKQKLVRVYSNGCRIFISYLTMQFDFEYTEHATMPIVILDGAVVILVTLLYFTLLVIQTLV